MIKKILKHPFFAGNLVMLIGSNFYNAGQFIYHFLTGRLLGKEGYGDLATFISIFGMVGIILTALNITIVKFIAVEKDKDKLLSLIKWVYWWVICIGAVVAVLLMAAGPFLTKFLNITQPPAFYFLPFIIFCYVLVASGRSILQGLLKFNQLVLSLLTESISKILISLILIVLGYALFGAMAGFLAGVFLSFIVVRYALSKYLAGARGKRPDLLPLLKYSSAAFVQSLSQTSMYSTDLILVKHFFSSEEAGIYASLSVLSRIVFFGATPIAQVMFPLVAKKYAQGSTYKNIFYLSLVLVLCFSLTIVLFFFFWPNAAIGILYGSAFLGGIHLLWWSGAFMALLAMAMILTQYFLSIGRTFVVRFFAIAAFLQAVLIWFIHPSLLAVIQISILSVTLLVISLLVYFLYKNFHGESK